LKSYLSFSHLIEVDQWFISKLNTSIYSLEKNLDFFKYIFFALAKEFHSSSLLFDFMQISNSSNNLNPHSSPRILKKIDEIEISNQTRLNQQIKKNFNAATKFSIGRWLTPVPWGDLLQRNLNKPSNIRETQA